MSRFKKHHVVHVGPNMTPMVDIVMCILIFFMLASTFAIQEVYLTNKVAVSTKGLGNQADDTKLPAVPQFIRLQRLGGATKVFAFGQMLEGIDLAEGDGGASGGAASARLDEIADFLRTKRAELSDDAQVVIRPEAAVPWQDALMMYDLCMRAQFKNVAFYPAE